MITIIIIVIALRTIVVIAVHHLHTTLDARKCRVPCHSCIAPGATARTRRAEASGVRSAPKLGSC